MFRFVAVLLWVGVACAGAQGDTGEPGSYHYSFYDQPVPIRLSLDHVAVHHADSQRKQDVRARLAGLGLLDAADVPWSIPDWEIADTAGKVRAVRDLVALQEALLADGTADFVSPVFFDAYGPLIVKPVILVGFRRDLTEARAERILADAGAGEIIVTEWGGMPLTYRLRAHATNGFDVLAAANDLAQHPDVLWAQPGRRFTARIADVIPNDPMFGDQWGLHNTGQQGGVVDLDMDLPEAWDIEKGSISATVVIMDTGVQQNHPDINQVTGHDFTDDGIFGGGPANVCDNHGTAVAGAVSATMNNGIGVAGVCPQCLTTSARVLISNIPCDGAGQTDTDWLVDAIQWADNLNYAVTSASLTYDYDSGVNQKYVDTRNAGLVHFAATGNEGVGTIGFPASCSAVHAVTGLDRFGNHYGNFGTGTTYTGQAVAVPTTDRTGADGYDPGDYVTTGGTSLATPTVAGVAALLHALDDTLPPSEIDFLMQTTCTDLGQSGYDTTWGWGHPNAHAAVISQLVSVCSEFGPSCYEDHFTPGCNSDGCCRQVCDADPFCCWTRWDENCVQAAIAMCSDCGEFGSGSCFTSNGTPACDDFECCAAVCVLDPSCCDSDWDAMCVSHAQTLCVASNDLCFNPTPITAGGLFAFDTTNATMDGLDHAACTAAGQAGIDKDLWFCLTAPSTGECELSTCGLTGVDTKIAVYDLCGACPPEDNQLLACNDDACGLQSFVAFQTIAGHPYYLRVGVFPGAPGGPGAFTIAYPSLGADDCVNATPIGGLGAFPFDNGGASMDGPDHEACMASGQPGIDRDVWFSWTSPESAIATITTCGQTTVDTKLAVYVGGECPPVDEQLIACNDDACGVQSNVEFIAAEGAVYLLRLGVYPGASGGSGTFTIDFQPGLPNDDCAGATAIGDGTVFFDTTEATTGGPPLPPECNEGNGLSFLGDIWYRYTASCNGQATVSLCGSAYDTRLAVYATDGCPGTILACNDDACGLQSEVVFATGAGAQYLVRVGGFSGSGAGVMVVECGPGPSCPGDTNGDNMVDVTDLLAVLGGWGACMPPCPPSCPADTNGDCMVDVEDLLLVLGAWGPC